MKSPHSFCSAGASHFLPNQPLSPFLERCRALLARPRRSVCRPPATYFSRSLQAARLILHWISFLLVFYPPPTLHCFSLKLVSCRNACSSAPHTPGTEGPIAQPIGRWAVCSCCLRSNAAFQWSTVFVTIWTRPSLYPFLRTQGCEHPPFHRTFSRPSPSPSTRETASPLCVLLAARASFARLTSYARCRRSSTRLCRPQLR